MRRSLVVSLLALRLLSCSPEEETDPSSMNIRTLDDAELRSVEASETLRFETNAPEGSTEQGGTLDLPFAPAISMDPVDGSKVSIRADTPVTEHEGKIYYFSSDENRRKFLEKPKAYLR